MCREEETPLLLEEKYQFFVSDLAEKFTAFATAILPDEVKNTETEALQNLSAVASELEQKATVIPKTEENITEQAVVEQTVPEQELHEEEETDDANHNEKILMLCRQGMSDVEIARTLGLGLGEVRLVIGLYKGEQTSEV